MRMRTSRPGRPLIRSFAAVALPMAGLLAALLLTGCGGGLPTDGPFGNGGTPGLECVPVPRGSVVSDGFEALENHATATAHITKVALADPHHGLKVLAAYVVPVTGNTLYGVAPGFPRRPLMPAGWQWAQRQVAVGAQVRGKTTANLLLVLQPAASGGWARGIDVYYQVSGQQYLLRTATRLRILVRPHSCL